MCCRPMEVMQGTEQGVVHKEETGICMNRVSGLPEAQDGCGPSTPLQSTAEECCVC